MLKVIFHLGKVAYSIEASKITEIVPLIPLESIPNTPQYFAGVLNYRGQKLPVIDLPLLITGQPAARRFSTRIMIVNAKRKNQQQLLGLIAEDVTQTFRNGTGSAPADIETVLPESMYDFLLDSQES